MYYTADVQKRVLEAMTAVSNGREVKLSTDNYNFNCCIAIRKANGWWSTSMIPTRYNPTDPSQADQQMLQFMGFLPKEFKIVTPEDAIAFAQLWTEEHCED